ncbi:hypothetical protein R6Q59_022443 [Mikania micrantha]
MEIILVEFYSQTTIRRWHHTRGHKLTTITHSPSQHQQSYPAGRCNASADSRIEAVCPQSEKKKYAKRLALYFDHKEVIKGGIHHL